MSLPADDLLSAFHDGNVSASEQATVERRLTLASSARQELSEIRQVSALLKGLPRETLPPEFPQQVLAAIEREMLVPARQVGRPSELRGRQRWVVGGAAVLTSAAGLLLMLNVFGHSPSANSRMVARSGSSSELRVARSDFAASGLPEEELLRDQPATQTLAMSAATTATSIPDGVAPTGPSAPLNMGRTSGLAGVSGLNRIEANLAEADSPNALPTRTSELYFDRSAFQSAQVGEVVEALRTEGDQVAVVRLTVVDRQEGLKELQLLLSNCQIEVAESLNEAEKLSESPIAKKGLDKADRPKDAVVTKNLTAAPDQLLAVFVESDADQLTAALQQLREAKNLERLEVESPILVAELDGVGIAPPAPAAAKMEDKTLNRFNSAKENKDQVALIDALTQAKKSMSPRRGVIPETTERKKSEALKLANKPAEAATREPQSVEKAKLAASTARQLAFQVPVQSLPQLEQSQTSRSQSLGGAAKSKQIATNRQSRAATDNADAKPARPMQVLFVVVDQAQSSQSQTPTTAPKSKALSKPRTAPTKPDSPDGAA